MRNVILIRYSEIHLKGKNRGFFEKLLIENIKHAVKDFNAKLGHIAGRYILTDYNVVDEAELIERLKCVSGIFSFSPAIEVESTLENISRLATELTRDLAGTFKIETNRADKTFSLNSMQVSREVGGNCLERNPRLKVDVNNPDTTVHIDIRESGNTYVFTQTVAGMGGMPVGSSGKGLLLLSGGIDSPVAGYMMAKRGVKIFALHFHSFPYTSPQAKEKVITLAHELSKYAGHIKMHVVSVTKIQQEIHRHCKSEFMITLLRRFMFKIAEKIAKENGYDMIITGENLGQVASQTIESMTVVENVVKSTVIARPLIAFDKVDIIAIARKIGTYETSIQPFEDCCTVFLPKNPVTKPKLRHAEFEETHLDVDALIADALTTQEIINI